MDPLKWKKTFGMESGKKGLKLMNDKLGMQQGHIRKFRGWLEGFDPAQRLNEKAAKEEVVPVEILPAKRQVRLWHEGEKRDYAYTFDETLWWDTQQKTCFEKVAQPICEDVLQGINGTIF